VLWIHADQAKAEKPIAVPIPRAACDVLSAQLGAYKQWVFAYQGEPIVSPKRSLNEACALAEVKNFTWHGLRHTWASWHVMGGWADMRMVLKYAHLDPGYVARYAENAVPWSAENSQSKLDVDQNVDQMGQSETTLGHSCSD
jgi:integrase